MFKKMMLLAVSAAALVAFAVPATASATPLIHAGGEGLSEVQAISEDTISVTEAGRLECATVVLDIELTTNNTETAHGHGTGAAFGTQTNHEDPRCWNPDIGQHVNVTHVRVNTIHLLANGTGTASFEFDFNIPGLIECTLNGSANVSYTPGSSSLSISGSLSGISPCPNGAISGTFDLPPGVTVG